MRNLTRAGQARFDERYDNTFQYTTPNFSGFNAKLAYSVHEDSVAASDHKTDSVSLSLNYAGGPFEASLAYEQVSEEATRGERDGIRLAAAYKLTSAAKLVGFYQTLDYTGLAGTSDAVQEQNTSDVYGLGAELKVAANTAIKPCGWPAPSMLTTATATCWPWVSSTSWTRRCASTPTTRWSTTTTTSR